MPTLLPQIRPNESEEIDIAECYDPVLVSHHAEILELWPQLDTIDIAVVLGQRYSAIFHESDIYNVIANRPAKVRAAA